MNEKPLVSLSPAEWKVMKIVSELQSCAARDVYQITEEQYGWKPSTTKTLLARLVEKGHLKTRPIGNCYLYEPVTSIVESVLSQTRELLKHSLDGNAAPLVFHMVKEGHLSDEDLQELHSLLDEYRKKGKNQKESKS